MKTQSVSFFRKFITGFMAGGLVLLLATMSAQMFHPGLFRAFSHKKNYGNYRHVDFQTLSSFDYFFAKPGETVVGNPLDQIPKKVFVLNGQKVAIDGFMIPLKGNWKQGVTKFILTPNQSLCCFGVLPPVNGWILTDMIQGKKSAFLKDRPITVYGTLKIGELKDGIGTQGLYQLEADKVETSDE